MSSAELPPTRRARAYRVVMALVCVMCIVVLVFTVADAARGGMGSGGKAVGVTAVLVVAGGLMGVVAGRGAWFNRRPSQWGMMTAILLLWAAIIIQRLG